MALVWCNHVWDLWCVYMYMQLKNVSTEKKNCEINAILKIKKLIS